MKVDGSESDTTINLVDISEEQDWTPDCENSSIVSMYNFSVRAVTLDDEEVYFGDWSPVEVTPGYCSGKEKQRASSMFLEIYSGYRIDVKLSCYFGGSKTAVFPPKTMKTMIRKTIASFVNILSVSGELL